VTILKDLSYIISFAYKNYYININRSFKKIIFKRLNVIINYIKGFLLRVKVRIKIKIIIRVFKNIKIIKIIKIISVIIKATKIKAINNTKSFYIKYNKMVL
jgi:hypothetical protein